jgi:hypothetical protein
LLPVLAALTATAAMLVTPPAFARTAHSYESVITEVPEKGPGGKSVPAPGGLELVNPMTADSGDLYVAEHLEGEGIAGSLTRTDQWAPSLSKPGEYEFVSQLPLLPELGAQPSGLAFGSAGSETEMYLGQSSGTTGVNVFGAGSCGKLECATFQQFWTGAGAPSPFEGVGGVAVDHSTSPGDWASGDVFVNAGGGVIDIFETEAGGIEHYVSQVTEAEGPIAVSGFNGDLVVGNKVFSPEKEGPTGKYVLACQLADPAGPVAPSSVTVDDSTTGTFAGEIYAITSGRVDEFGPECTFRGSIAGVPKEGMPGGVKGQTEEVAFGPLKSLTVDPVSHRVFVGQDSGLGFNAPGVVDVFSADVVVPDVVTEAPSNLILESDPETGAVSWDIGPTGTVNPLNEPETSCGFAWGLTDTFGQDAPCSASGLTGASPVPVHASLTKLEPNTDYFYRLHAQNEHAVNPGEASETYRFTTPGPALRVETVSDVSSSSATFEGTIAPHDAPNYAAKLEGSERAQDLQAPAKTPTSYYFQYNTTGTGMCTAKPGACTSMPSSPASVGSATGDVDVSQPALGLAANTTYHYRLVAVHEALPESKPGVLTSFYGPDRTFTTQGAGGPLVLPDGRAWELVSPADKLGAELSPNGSGRAAAGGGQFTFVTNIPTESSPPGSPSNGVQVLATREAPGQWSNVDIALSRTQPEGIFIELGEAREYRLFSEDFSSAVALYKREFSVPEGWHQNELGEWEHFVESSPVPTEETPYLRHNTTCESAPASCYEPLLDAEDVTSGLKHAGKTGFDGGTPDGSHLYIVSQVQLTTAKAPEHALYEWSASRPPAQRLSLLNVTPSGEPLPAGIAAVTADGSRVILDEGADLYLRDATSGEVAQLDLREDGSQPASHGAGWVGASTDASKLFFTFAEPLTKDSELSGGLYVCEVASAPLKCVLKDLTPTPAPGQPGFGEHAQVTTTLGVSGDGSRVYFFAQGVLAAGAKPGATNLYVAHEQEGKWTTSYIASPQGIGEQNRVSPDGRWLAFSTQTPLTGYDNRDAKTGQPDSEVYLYDAETGRLACASCNPSGARPVGSSVVPPTQFQRQSGFEPRSRALFDTGRLFFNSGDALFPQDANGNTDVYEFEPAGVGGGCTPASTTFTTATGGCVGMISSGVASGPSEFLDASATGADAFFTTRERLVPQDVDDLLDVYDAHECTASSPCAPPSEPSPEACRSAEACRTAPQPQPSIFGEPPSALFTGPGNLGGGPPNPPAKPKSAAEIRAEKLSKALASCRHRYKHQRKRRAVCEKHAHKAYGTAKKPQRARKAADANRRAGR